MQCMSWKGVGKAVSAYTLGGVLLSVVPWLNTAQAGDPYLDALAEEVGKIGQATATGDAGPPADKVGKGFSPLMSKEEFAEEMKHVHPGGNVLFVQLSPLERDNIYVEYYKRGSSYQDVVDVMDKWLKRK